MQNWINSPDHGLLLFDPIDRTLFGATTSGQSGPGSNGNEGVLHNPQSFSITGTSPWNFLVSYLGHSLEGGLLLYRGAVGVFYSPSWLAKRFFKLAVLFNPWLSEGDEWLHTFTNCICSKVNVIARLGFELGYKDDDVKRFNDHTTLLMRKNLINIIWTSH